MAAAGFSIEPDGEDAVVQVATEEEVASEEEAGGGGGGATLAEAVEVVEEELPEDQPEEEAPAASRKRKAAGNCEDQPAKQCMCCEAPLVKGSGYCMVHKATVECIKRQLKWQDEKEQKWVKAAQKKAKSDPEQAWIQLVLRVEAKCPSLGQRCRWA